MEKNMLYYDCELFWNSLALDNTVKSYFMKIHYIIKKFSRQGFTITRYKDSIIVKTPDGFVFSFSSYNEAYNFFIK